MKVSPDGIMATVEGENGKCHIQFDDGYPTVWVDGGCYCFARLDNTRTLEVFLNFIFEKVENLCLKKMET